MKSKEFIAKNEEKAILCEQSVCSVIFGKLKSDAKLSVDIK